MHPYAAIVVLPYTRVRRGVEARLVYRMSHFTARAVLAGYELYQQGTAPVFILPGEQHGPATSELEQFYLVRRGVPADRITTMTDLNGTLQQLERMAQLQKRSKLGRIIVVCFGFHEVRVRALIDMLGVRGDTAEVERVHVDFLRVRGASVRVNRDELLNLPQLDPVRRAEEGITGRLLALDRPFGRRAPLTRLFKMLMGPTITDIERGRARIGLSRLEPIRRLTMLLRN